jgi:hypothetical protein
MTNVLVHYWKPEGHELNNVEMLFSRGPALGESVYLNQARYDAVRVDHHPERNSEPRKVREYTGSEFPQDAEIWLKRAAVDNNPIRSSHHVPNRIDSPKELANITCTKRGEQVQLQEQANLLSASCVVIGA